MIEIALGFNRAQRESTGVETNHTKEINMNTNSAFRALTANRKARQNQGGFNVRALTQSGAPSKSCSRDYSGQYEFTLERAEALKATLERNNPGRTWVVLPA